MPVCGGNGSSIVADCIGQNNSGISYLKTGVCHQATNRILWVANVFLPLSTPTVFGSVWLYGIFGEKLEPFVWVPTNDRWSNRKNSCSPPGAGSAGGVASSSISPAATRKGPMVSLNNADEPNDWSELGPFIESGLGRKLDAPTIEGLALMRAELQVAHGRLLKMLASGVISPEDYTNELTLALRAAKIRGNELLGELDFEKIFGRFDSIQSIGGDPEIFLEEENQNSHGPRL
jgi:hypothetical protein